MLAYYAAGQCKRTPSQNNQLPTAAGASAAAAAAAAAQKADRTRCT